MRAKKWIYDKETQTISINPESDLWPRAFQNYRSVVKFILPDGISALPDACFSGCSKLESICLPESLTVIGKDCFRDCASLKHIEIPAGVLDIPDEAFVHCHALRSVIFKGAVKNIGKRAFHGTQIETIYLPESLEKIDDGAFSDIDPLKTLHLPKNLKSLGEYVFPDKGSLKRITSDAKAFPVIDNMLYGQEGEELIYIPPATKRKRLVFSEGLRKIKSGSGRGQQHVEELVFPEGLEEIGIGAFACMPALRYVRFMGSGQHLILASGKGYGREHESLKRAGIFANTPLLEQVILPPQLKEIPSWMFLSSGLSYIELPPTLESIQEGAFACCNFQKIQVPDGITYLGTGAFYGTDELILPNTVHTDNGDLASIAGHVSMHAWPQMNWNNHWLKVQGLPPLWFGAEDDMGRVVLQSIFIHDKVHLKAYDDAFKGATGIENRIRMALCRLLRPVELTAEAKERYLIFLDQFALHTLKLLMLEQSPTIFREITNIWTFPVDKLTEALKMVQDSGQTEFIQQILALQQQLQPKKLRRKRL